MQALGVVGLVDDVAVAFVLGLLAGHVVGGERRAGEDLDGVVEAAGGLLAEGDFVDGGRLVVGAAVCVSIFSLGLEGEGGEGEREREKKGGNTSGSRPRRSGATRCWQWSGCPARWRPAAGRWG